MQCQGYPFAGGPEARGLQPPRSWWLAQRLGSARHQRGAWAVAPERMPTLAPVFPHWETPNQLGGFLLHAEAQREAPLPEITFASLQPSKLASTRVGLGCALTMRP